MKSLKPAERLIVAADFRGSREGIRRSVLALALDLQDSGVCIKLNSALRSMGEDIIDTIQSSGLKVFADLKLYDIAETLSTDGMLLKQVRPAFLTVACFAGAAAIWALKKELPETEVLGVTVLTGLSDAQVRQIHNCPRDIAVCRLAEIGQGGGVDGFICPGQEVWMLRGHLERKDLTFNVPAIRPAWAGVPGDDQSPDLIMTPGEAIRAGADRIIVGRPIIYDDNPREAVQRTIEEIESALVEQG